jgi:hypothetical protein
MSNKPPFFIIMYSYDYNLHARVSKASGHSAKRLAPDSLVLKLCRIYLKEPGIQTFCGMCLYP